MYKLRRFVSYYRPEWKLFLIDMLCAAAVAGLDLIFPIVTRLFMKDFIPNLRIRPMFIFGGVLVGLYLLRMLGQYVLNYWGHVVGVRMEYHMRKDLFTHLQTMDFRFFDDNKVGHLMSRLVNDLRDITELAHHGPEDLLIATLMFIGSFTYLIRINVSMTLIAFAFVPVLAWYAISRRRSMRDAFLEERRKVADVNSEVENSLSGIRVAKSFTNEEYEMERFDGANSRFREARQQAFKAMAEYSSGMTFLTNLLDVTVLVAGGVYAYLGHIDLADLTSYLMFVRFFLVPIHRLTAFTQQFEQGMSGFTRFLDLMEQKPSIVESPNAQELRDVQGKIEIKNVSFGYEEGTDVLKDINLTIEAGKTVALVGSSGGGKTTLCHLIPRFYDVDEGQILVDGHDVRDLTLQSLRASIGLVQQDVFLFTGTIKENILYGRPTATDEEIVEAAKNARIHDFIMSLPDKYDTYVGERGVKLSGGQKQRISIARVFLKNPPILLLDEATSALDTTTEMEIQEALERLSQDRTTVIIAHRLSTVKNADEIVVIDGGRIEEQGSHTELMERRGIYHSLYRAQFNRDALEELFEKRGLRQADSDEEAEEEIKTA